MDVGTGGAASLAEQDPVKLRPRLLSQVGRVSIATDMSQLLEPIDEKVAANSAGVNVGVKTVRV
jgi:hypothetical protein